jgi:hypothetical protein
MRTLIHVTIFKLIGISGHMFTNSIILHFMNVCLRVVTPNLLYTDRRMDKHDLHDLHKFLQVFNADA